MSEPIRLTTDNMLALEELATQAGTDPEAFMTRALRRGLYLASVVLNAQPGKRTFVLFEKPNEGGYRGCVLDFSSNAPTDMCELEDAFYAGIEPTTIEIDEELVKEVTTIAALLGTDRGSFVNHSINYDLRWQATRDQGGDVLIDDSHAPQGQYLEISRDY